MNSVLEKTLDDIGLNLPPESDCPEYTRYIFGILRAGELKKYYPATLAKHKLYNEFCRMMGGVERANPILNFYRDCEAQRRLFAKARLDPQAAEALKVFRGTTKAPLMAELPTETAYILWSRAGSWSGALAMAGLRPMNHDQLLMATHRYAVKHLSPNLLSQEIQDKLSSATMKELSAFCNEIRKRDKYPSQKDIPQKLITRIWAAGFTVQAMFRRMGIRLPLAQGESLVLKKGSRNSTNGRHKETPDDVDWNSLLESTYQEHARHVFIMLRAEEMGKYHPVYSVKKKAYEDLSHALRGQKYASPVLEIYRDYETQCRTFDPADPDPEFSNALEVLRGQTVTPLMMELPVETAYILWARAGSWAGALSLAGLAPLTDSQRAAAVERYAAANASLSWIPKDIRWKFSRKLLSQLSAECDKVRKIGVFPHQNSIPEQLVIQLKEKHFTVRKIFWYMGITCRTDSAQSTLEVDS